MKWVDGTDLEQWANRVDSRALLPEVIRRLVYATVPSPRRIEFRSGEGVQLAGWDGYVEAPSGNDRVPQGVSCWELGTGRDPRAKAQEDYGTRTANPLGINPGEATFVVVTPRRWAGKTAWAQERRAEGVWRDVRVYDADDLEAWLLQAPGVGAWLARQIGKYPPHVSSLEDFWNEFASTTNPPLNGDILLAGRGEEQARVNDWLRDQPSILHVRADTPREATAFVAACVMQLPETERITLCSRTLATDDPETLRALSSKQAGLLLFYDGTDTAPTPVAVQRGHRVLIPVPLGVAPLTNEVALPRPSREAFAKALQGAGYPEEQALALARQTGRSISALRRRFAVARPAAPAWAQPAQADDLISMLFAGSWDDQRPADREVLAELTGRPYEQVSIQATAWTQGADPPLRRAGSVYAFAAPLDAWRQVGQYITRDALDRFVRTAERVLSLDDPRLTLVPEERWLAAIRDQLPAHSEALREGIARTLVLLSVLGEDGTIPGRVQDGAMLVVGRVLAPGVSWRRWYSVADVMRLLAEAAPQAFLDGLQAQLAPATPDLMRLFDEEGGGFAPHSMHTHLLWALEVLAWEPAFLAPVTLTLGRLARLDPGGHLQNRPINSLRGIFLFWHPNTSATLAQRMQALDLLIAREPGVAWDLFSKLMPKSFDTGSCTAQPQWRRVVAPPRVTYGERDQGMTYILERALTLAGMDASRLAFLVLECGPPWPPALQERLVAQVHAFADAAVAPGDRATVWAALRQLVNRCRAHPDADWALREDALTPLAVEQARLIPTDLTTRYGWLFDDWWPDLGQPRGENYDAIEASVEQARRDALHEVLQADGHDGLIALTQVVKHPWFVGRTAADVIDSVDNQRELLMATLGSATASTRFFGQALVTRWHQRSGEPWVDVMLTAPLIDNPYRTTVFLLGLPFERNTWSRVTTAGQEIEHRYWGNVQAWLPQSVTLDDLTYAVDHLIENGRAFVALDLIGLHVERATAPMLVGTLNAVRDALIAGAGTPAAQHFGLDLERIFQRLDAAGVAQQDITRLEWFFLPLLSQGRLTPTLTLHRELARDPALFTEVISAVYRAHSRNPDEEPTPTEQEAARARVAYELLSSWNIVPGSTDDGSVAPVVLNAWVDDARARCTACDREVIGDQHIGQILACAPVGADGIWPHSALRDLIDRVGSLQLESGIRTGIFNGRGAFARSLTEGGAQERAIAARHRGYAEALAVSHPRTAGMLRRIAEDYERFAEHEDERAEQRDLD